MNITIIRVISTISDSSLMKEISDTKEIMKISIDTKWIENQVVLGTIDAVIEIPIVNQIMIKTFEAKAPPTLGELLKVDLDQKLLSLR